MALELKGIKQFSYGVRGKRQEIYRRQSETSNDGITCYNNILAQGYKSENHYFTSISELMSAVSGMTKKTKSDSLQTGTIQQIMEIDICAPQGFYFSCKPDSENEFQKILIGPSGLYDYKNFEHSLNKYNGITISDAAGSYNQNISYLIITIAYSIIDAN